MGGGDSYTSPFTSVSHSDLERLPEDEIEELREQLQTSLDEHESVPGVTSLGTSETDIPQIRGAEADPEAASEVRSMLGADADAADSDERMSMSEIERRDEELDDRLSALDESDSGGAGAGIEVGGSGPGGSTTATSSTGTDGDGADFGTDREVDWSDPDDIPIDRSSLDIDPPDLSGVDSKGELARSLFTHEGSVKPSKRAGDGGPDKPLVSSDGTIGQWHSFEMPNDVNVTPLKSSGDATGRTAADMEVADIGGLDIAGEYGTDKAYITHYGPYTNTDLVNAGWEIGASTFADELGANVPSHVFNPDEGYVAAEGFDGDPIEEADPSKVQNIDKDQLLDTLAVQILAGNDDLHGNNVFVADDGTTACIDLDIAGEAYSSRDSMKFAARGPGQVEMKGGPSFKNSEVVDRAQEIAVGLHNDGRVDGIVERTKQAEAAVSGTESVGEAVQQNIQMLVEDARAKQNGGGS